MSQKGSTLSLYPSSVTCYNTAAATAAANNNNNIIMNDHHHSSSDDDDDDHDPSSKNGIGGGKSRRELPSGAVATLKAWLLAPEHFTHPYPTPQDQVMLMQKTGIDKKQLKNWFTNARRRIWKPMLKKQLEAGKLAAGVSMTTTGVAASCASLGGVEGGGEGGMPIPELMGSFQQQQQQQNQRYSQHQQPEPRQEMYSNFQQAQTHQHQVIDPSPSYEQQQYQQQQVQFLQDIGQMHQQPVYDQYGNQIYENTAASYQQQYPYQQDNQSTVSNNNDNMHHANSSDNTNNNFPISNSIGSLPPMTLGGNSIGGGGGGSASSLFGNNMVKTDSHAVLMELFARDQDLVRQAASKGMAGAVVVGGGSIHAGGGQQPQGMANNNGTLGGTDCGGGISSASSIPGNVRWAAGSVGGGGGGGSGPVLQKQHSVTFEGVSSSLSSWPNFSSVSSLNNLGGLQGVKSITNLSAADLSSQGNLNKMGNLAHVKSFENMGRFDSFAFLEVFFDDKSGLNSSIHGNNGLRGVKRERDDDDAVGLSLDGDDGTSPGQFNNSSNKSSSDQGPDPASDSGGEVGALLTYEDNDGYEGNETDGETLKRAYDDALAARGLIAVRRSCEKLTDLALPAKMQRTLSQEYIRQHNQGQHMGDFFSTNNSAYAPNSRRNSNSNNNNNNNCSLQMVLSDGGGNGNMNTSSVEVPSSTTCTLCMFVNVDTQLRPCGHMFHGRCLKPSLQITVGPPKCPICNTSMQSAILAVPTEAT